MNGIGRCDQGCAIFNDSLQFIDSRQIVHARSDEKWKPHNHPRRRTLGPARGERDECDEIVERKFFGPVAAITGNIGPVNASQRLQRLRIAAARGLHQRRILLASAVQNSDRQDRLISRFENSFRSSSWQDAGCGQAGVWKDDCPRSRQIDNRRQIEHLLKSGFAQLLALAAIKLLPLSCGHRAQNRTCRKLACQI